MQTKKRCGGAYNLLFKLYIDFMNSFLELSTS